MPLTPGTRLGSYEIVAAIGAGGMGEVYRAKDTRLNRDVALKILPDAFTSDADRLARFRREAQVLASLNHPNIAAIYGFEDSGATHALVMELVEGEDLSELIGDQRRSAPAAVAPSESSSRGATASGGGAPRAINIEDALPIARQIADALEAAHEQGIVHRDLKPQNIKLRTDGTVKVLDFGLAKAVQGDGSQGDRPGSRHQGPSPSSLTMTSPAMTQMGMILGTAAYMSPEQAKGKAVDKRADIWAFGVVFYEMLTGARAFRGDDVSELLASVLREAPDFTLLPADTPASVRRLLRRCLEKDPRKRLSAIGDARLELDDADSPTPTATVAASPTRRRGVALIVAAALALAGVAAAAGWYVKPAATLPVRLLELPEVVASSTSVAMSPDGTRVAYVSTNRLYVQALDSVTPRELSSVSTPNAEGATVSPGTVFWSPDSKTIGFSAGQEIRTVPAAGGPVFVVARIPSTGEALAARWFHDGAIVFAVWRDSVYSVPAAGGTPVVSLALDAKTEIDAHWISEAPRGRLIARIHQRSGDRFVTVLASRSAGAQPRVLLTDDQTIDEVQYVAPGFVIFGRHTTNVGLWVAPFSGGPIDLTTAKLIEAGAESASIADDGSLTFVLPARFRATPAWFDRTGAVSAIGGAPIPERADGFALSPDGRRLAIALRAEATTALGQDETSLVVRDLATGTDTRLLSGHATDHPGSAVTLIQDPSWFPSGDRILFSGGEVESGRLLVQKSDEATVPHELVNGLILGRIAHDGRTLAAVQDDRGQFHLMQAPISADGAVAPAQRVVQDGDPSVGEFDLSPDGRLVVYAARQANGQHTIYLSGFPTGHAQWLVADDASQPRFSPDGHEVFYVKSGAGSGSRGTGTLMSRIVTTTPAVTLGAETTLIGGDLVDWITKYGYSVAPDGRRFLVLKPVAPAPGEGKRMLWMQNWPAAIRK